MRIATMLFLIGFMMVNALAVVQSASDTRRRLVAMQGQIDALRARVDAGR